MRYNTGYSENTKTNWKIVKSEILSGSLILGLIVLAYFFISISLYCEQWHQNLFLGLGTGAATSALVSLVLYLNDKQIKIREQIKQRSIFMDEFKSLYRNIIYLMNFESSKEVTLDLESYIKKQHRWYHEYYKRMIANNFTEEETIVRIKCLTEFISSNLPRFQQLFEYGSEWKRGGYTSWQKYELLNFYAEFKSIQIYIKQKEYRSAFLNFSYFLERIKRMSNDFPELENFQLLKFEYDKTGNMNIDSVDFEEKEPDFKFAREFQEIRHSNYIKYYSKETEKIELQ